MDMTRYLVRRVGRYLMWAVGVMAIYAIFILVRGVSPSEGTSSVMLCVALFGYPAYRVLRGTVTTIVDYYDPGATVGVNLFAYVCSMLAPRFFENNEKRVYQFNLLSKFLQIVCMASVIYAFTASDYEMFRVLVVIVALAAAFAMYVLIRVPARVHSQTQRNERAELIDRRCATDFPPDAGQVKKFMTLPRVVLGTNVAFEVVGALILVFYPQPGWAPLYYICEFIKVVGFMGFLTLWLCVYYYVSERHRSFSYLLEKGKGEYGQVKIEFYTYEGTGDSRKETRHKIDRVESFEIGGRYIYVTKVSKMIRVKIPRTFANERLLIRTLEIMMA